MRLPFQPRRVDPSPDALLTRASRSTPPFYQQFRRQQRRLRLLGVLLGILLLAIILPFSPVHRQALGYGGGGVAVALEPVCGHFAEVITRLHQVHPFELPKVFTTPTKEQLLHLPTPSRHKITTTSDATYDPTHDQLCVGGWDAIGRFFSPPPLGQSGTSYDLGHDVGSLFSTFWTWAGTSLSSILTDVQSFGFMVSTPKSITYDHDVVKNLEAWMVKVVDAMLVLVIVVGGYGYLFGFGTQRFREFIPGLIIGAIAAHFCLPLLAQFIELCNALCAGVLGSLASAGIGNLTPPLGIRELLNWATAPEYLVLVYLIELLCAVLLSLVMALRIALLNLLLVTAPLGTFCLCCFALPQLRAWGVLWAQAFVATLIAQFLQVLCLGIGAAMAASFGHGSLTPVSILVGIAALFLAGKVPDMLLSNVLRARVLSSGTASDFGQQVATVASTGAEWFALLAA